MKLKGEDVNFVSPLTKTLERQKRDASLAPPMMGAQIIDAMAHSWIIRFLKHRIADKRILRLIAKWSCQRR